MGVSILVIGGGGREHSLGWKLAQSPEVDKVFFAPGNGGTASVGENVAIKADELSELVRFAKSHKIALTVVGPEQPLVDGIVELFEKEGLPIFGPSTAAAQLEASKAFAADFMNRHGIPQPESVTADSLTEAQAYTRQHKPTDYVIKTSGLAGGKGVIVPDTRAEAEVALIDIMGKKVFGDSGNQVVFQQRLHGQEVSAFALSDGQNIVMLPFFQDHKQIFDGDNGPNTGGIGAYSPVAIITDALAERIKTEVMQAAIDGMNADGKPYRGVLYAGLFVTEAGEPKVIEFNCRLGDPECEPMMRLIDDDLYPLFMQCAKGQLQTKEVNIRPGSVACVILCSGGYPGSFKVGYPILGLETVSNPEVVIFHSGTKLDNDALVTQGGRVLAVTAYGSSLELALTKTYAQIGPAGIHFKDMHYRTDIGRRPGSGVDV